ncbi:MAG: hypothetical protein WCT46_01330 [Candidatus Gracilibacteria bacterium]
MPDVIPDSGFNLYQTTAEAENVCFKVEDLRCMDRACSGTMTDVFAAKTSLGMMAKDRDGKVVPAQCPCCQGPMEKAITGGAIVGLTRKSADVDRNVHRTRDLAGKTLTFSNPRTGELSTGTVIVGSTCEDCHTGIAFVVVEPEVHGSTMGN